jgi:hypothetical protein
MEPESPSPYPQVPATCPYPEPTPFQIPSNMSVFRLRLHDTRHILHNKRHGERSEVYFSAQYAV